jgi:ribosomal-protein-alanine N-acetyltransferase
MGLFMSNVTIRRAEPQDVIKLRELELSGFTSPWGEETIRQELDNNGRTCYVVAQADNQIIGYAGLWVIFDEGHITRVVVEPNYRRLGVGKNLVENLMAEAYACGCGRFTLEVRSTNLAAFYLYKALGFKRIGVRPGYYEEEGEDAVIMWFNPPEYILEGNLNERR